MPLKKGITQFRLNATEPFITLIKCGKWRVMAEYNRERTASPGIESPLLQNR
jgi:hypothetical protein